MKQQGIYWRAIGRGLCAAVLALSLGACSSTPDWANPVEWYKGTAEWIGGEDEETVAARKAARQPENAPPNADQPYPKLASVPDRPAGSADRKDRRAKVENALVADRANAQHVALGGVDRGPALKDEAPATTAPVSQTASAEPPPPQPVQVKPDPSVYPPNGSNPAFQAAIAQQNSAALSSRRDRGPIRRNTIGVPPTPRSGVELTPPGSSSATQPATGGRPATGPRPGVQTGTLAPASGMPVLPTGHGEPVATVLFANNSSRISARYFNVLRSIVKMQKERGGAIKVIGHASSRTVNTDPMSHRIANFRVSLARARAVAERLVRMGAPADRIEVAGVADSQPIYQEIMPMGEAGNRRAEIFLEN